MKKTLLSLVFLLTAIAAGAQSITNATFSYTFNGEGSRVSFPESGFSTLDLSETVAENFKIDAITVQTSGPVNDVTMYGAQYKSGDKDPEIIEIPLVAQEGLAGDGNVWWYIPGEIFEHNMDNGWIVKDNDRSTATRYLTFYFVANKDKTPAYYNNGGNNYSIRFKTEGKGGGDQSGNITFYDTYTAALTLSMTGGKYSNITYTYAGDGSRDISDQPGEVRVGIGELDAGNTHIHKGSFWKRLDFQGQITKSMKLLDFLNIIVTLTELDVHSELVFLHHLVQREVKEVLLEVVNEPFLNECLHTEPDHLLILFLLEHRLTGDPVRGEFVEGFGIHTVMSLLVCIRK